MDFIVRGLCRFDKPLTVGMERRQTTHITLLFHSVFHYKWVFVDVKVAHTFAEVLKDYL